MKPRAETKERCVICKPIVTIANKEYVFKGEKRPVCEACYERGTYVSKMLRRAVMRELGAISPITGVS